MSTAYTIDPSLATEFLNGPFSVARHVSYCHRDSGILTPWVSVSPVRGFVDRFDGNIVVTANVDPRRLVPVGQGGDEWLVPQGIFPDEISEVTVDRLLHSRAAQQNITDAAVRAFVATQTAPPDSVLPLGV